MERVSGRLSRDLTDCLTALDKEAASGFHDPRWGRTYESFSSDPSIVREYATAYVRGAQGRFTADGNVVATAKHYIGDGATDNGRDQGEATVDKATM